MVVLPGTERKAEVRSQKANGGAFELSWGVRQSGLDVRERRPRDHRPGDERRDVDADEKLTSERAAIHAAMSKDPRTSRPSAPPPFGNLTPLAALVMKNGSLLSRAGAQSIMMEAIRQSLGRLDERLTSMDSRIDRRFTAIDQRFSVIDQRFLAIDGQLAAIRAEMVHQFRWYRTDKGRVHGTRPSISVDHSYGITLT